MPRQKKTAAPTPSSTIPLTPERRLEIEHLDAQLGEQCLELADAIQRHTEHKAAAQRKFDARVAESINPDENTNLAEVETAIVEWSQKLREAKLAITMAKKERKLRMEDRDRLARIRLNNAEPIEAQTSLDFEPALQGAIDAAVTAHREQMVEERGEQPFPLDQSDPYTQLVALVGEAVAQDYVGAASTLPTLDPSEFVEALGVTEEVAGLLAGIVGGAFDTFTMTPEQQAAAHSAYAKMPPDQAAIDAAADIAKESKRKRTGLDDGPPLPDAVVEARREIRAAKDAARDRVRKEIDRLAKEQAAERAREAKASKRMGKAKGKR